MGKLLLAPGFRFNPTDVEILKYYLKRKLMGKRLHFEVIAEVDIYKFEPWDLPGKSCWDTGDLKWYFFCPRAKKYRNGNRIQRATEGGYWKTTGKDRSVLYNGEAVGCVKTLIFHSGRPPKGDRTDWVMHEYKLEDRDLTDRGVPLDSYVICMIFKKEGVGPRNGAQYGAPFKEEDWSDNEEEITFEAVQDANMPEPDLCPPCNYNNSITPYMHPGSCIYDTVSPPSKALQPVSSNYVTVEKPHASDCDYFLSGNGSSNNGSTSTDAHFPKVIGTDPSLESCKVLQPVSCNYVTMEQPGASDDDIQQMLNCFAEESAFQVHQPVSCNYVTMEQPGASDDDDIQQMLNCFAEESAFLQNENEKKCGT